jgi:hypothetical protein
VAGVALRREAAALLAVAVLLGLSPDGPTVEEVVGWAWAVPLLPHDWRGHDRLVGGRFVRFRGGPGPELFPGVRHGRLDNRAVRHTLD